MGNNVLQEIHSNTNYKIRDEENANIDEDCKGENIDEFWVHIQLLYSNFESLIGVEA